jgi:hypothetical protein
MKMVVLNMMIITLVSVIPYQSIIYINVEYQYLWKVQEEWSEWVQSPELVLKI